MHDVAHALASEGLAAIGIDIAELGTRGDLSTELSWIPFLHVEDLARGRDSMRQTQADLFCLTRAVMQALAEAPGERVLDAENLAFPGTSLGGILGTADIALEPSARGAALFVTGAPSSMRPCTTR